MIVQLKYDNSNAETILRGQIIKNLTLKVYLRDKEQSAFIIHW